MARLLRSITMNGWGSSRSVMGIVAIVSVSVLAYHGTLDASTFVALMAPIIGVVAGSAVTQHSFDHTLDKVTQPGGKRSLDPPSSTEEGTSDVG